jgi:glycosyltransferase involved in cell wall biosynthesis
MAAGTLAVISSIDVLRETAHDIALETPPGDVQALCDALWVAATRSVHFRERVDRGIRRALDFTTERMTAATIEVYVRTAARGRAHTTTDPKPRRP